MTELLVSSWTLAIEGKHLPGDGSVSGGIVLVVVTQNIKEKLKHNNHE